MPSLGSLDPSSRDTEDAREGQEGWEGQEGQEAGPTFQKQMRDSKKAMERSQPSIQIERQGSSPVAAGSKLRKRS